MGYRVLTDDADMLLTSLTMHYDVYAPAVFPGSGGFSDTDQVRYKKIRSMDEIVFDKKADYSMKEVLLPIVETLFYFTEDETRVPVTSDKKILILLRHCDLNGVKRLDEIYLRNGFADAYYKQIKDRVRFAVMGCVKSFENCFCVSMESNYADNYDMSIDKMEDFYEIDCPNDELSELIAPFAAKTHDVKPAYVKENQISVSIPKNLTAEVGKAPFWKEYDSRCISCGRCNFVCPTCTCYTMQDLYYKENEKAGERRRVWASCMVDGFTDVAGGHSYRNAPGERMRFRVLHKVLDFKERFGYQMCVGCGRCDDVCPEYISFSTAVNRLSEQEVYNKERKHYEK